MLINVVKFLEFDSDIEIIPTYDSIEYLDFKFRAFPLSEITACNTSNA